MAIPTLPAYPPAPTPSDSIEVFDQKAFSHVASLEPQRIRFNAALEWVSLQMDTLEDTVTQTGNLRAQAQTQANNAAASANLAGVRAADAHSAKQQSIDAKNEAQLQAVSAKGSSTNAALAAAEAIAAVGEKMPLLMQPQVISNDITIPTGYNALIIGEFHVNPGVIIEGQGSATLRGL